MASSLNVFRRGTTFYFRRVWPKSVRPHVGMREFVRSLKTADRRLAGLLARSLYVCSENLVLKLRAADMLTETKIAELVADFRTLVLEIDNGLRISEPPLDEVQHAELRTAAGQMLADIGDELSHVDHRRADFALDILVRRHQLRLGEFEQAQLRQAIMIAGTEMAKVIERRTRGDFSDGVSYSNLVAASNDVPVERSPGRLQPPAPDKAPPTAGASTNKSLFSNLSIAFLRDQRGGKIWEEQTARQAEKTFSLFKELHGDRELTNYSRKDAASFKTRLQELPADYGKAATFRNAQMEEILALDKGRSPAVARLSMTTVKRHFSALSSMWQWAAQNGHVDSNPFQGHSFPSRLRANEQRDMWQLGELDQLFQTPVWTGCLSPTRRSTPGSVIVRDEKFWLPIIAVLSGMRQEEICQLHVEDIKEVEGYWVFDINSKPPRRLKNRNAIRRVPIHSELKRLGFLDYVEKQRAIGQILLFPQLTSGGADGRLGHGYSKWFARYRQDVGLYRKGLDFHSFRHTATTLMQHAGVAIAAIDELTGHATPGETARYSHGLRMEQLHSAIEAINVRLAI